jgi:hypothetical protein
MRQRQTSGRRHPLKPNYLFFGTDEATLLFPYVSSRTVEKKHPDTFTGISTVGVEPDE